MIILIHGDCFADPDPDQSDGVKVILNLVISVEEEAQKITVITKLTQRTIYCTLNKAHSTIFAGSSLVMSQARCQHFRCDRDFKNLNMFLVYSRGHLAWHQKSSLCYFLEQKFIEPSTQDRAQTFNTLHMPRCLLCKNIISWIQYFPSGIVPSTAMFQVLWDKIPL